MSETIVMFLAMMFCAGIAVMCWIISGQAGQAERPMLILFGMALMIGGLLAGELIRRLIE